MEVMAFVCPWYSLTGSVRSTCHSLAMWSLEAVCVCACMKEGVYYTRVKLQLSWTERNHSCHWPVKMYWESQEKAQSHTHFSVLLFSVFRRLKSAVDQILQVPSAEAVASRLKGRGKLRIQSCTTHTHTIVEMKLCCQTCYLLYQIVGNFQGRKLLQILQICVYWWKFLWECGDVASLGAAKASNPQKVPSVKIVFLTNSCESFLPQKFSTISFSTIRYLITFGMQ